MRRFVCIATLTAVVLLCAGSAQATLMAYATWNGGPSEWTISNNWAAGFDLVASGSAQNATWTFDFGRPDFPEAEPGAGKWDGGLVDEVDNDAGCYVMVNEWFGGPDSLLTAAGTIALWFKPEWDPVTDTEAHNLMRASSGADWDGLNMLYNGDGTLTTTFLVPSEPPGEISHVWTGNPLVADWNHLAFTWDATGMRSYANGALVGETVYGVSDPVVEYPDWYLMFFGQDGNWTGDQQSDGTYDSLGIWDEALVGATYDVPTEEIDSTTGLPGSFSGLGDRDGDGFVGQDDLDIVLGSWGTSPPLDPRADVDGDDFVGQTDLDAVLGDWGRGVPPPAVPEPATLGMFAFCGITLLRRKSKSR